MRPLNPWQKVPDWWICAECGVRADGFWTARGLVVFACSKHRQPLADWLMDDVGFGHISGVSATRHTWRYYAKSRYWRLRSALRPRTTDETHSSVRAALEAAFNDGDTLLARAGHGRDAV